MGVKKVDVPDVVDHVAPGPVVILVPLLHLVITGPPPDILKLKLKTDMRISTCTYQKFYFGKTP